MSFAFRDVGPACRDDAACVAPPGGDHDVELAGDGADRLEAQNSPSVSRLTSNSTRFGSRNARVVNGNGTRCFAASLAAFASSHSNRTGDAVASIYVADIVWTTLLRGAAINAVNRARRGVLVAPLTTSTVPRPPIRAAVPSVGPGLVAACDQARAVDKRRLTSRRGRLSAADTRAAENAVRTVLGR
jgi:hypothetical protein